MSDAPLDTPGTTSSGPGRKRKDRVQAQQNKCLNEKRRREQENVYMEELAELIQVSITDMSSCSAVKPDKCAILQETVNKIRHIQKHEENGSADAVQQSQVSSTKSGPLATDVIGPLLLEALDGFLFVVNGQSMIDFVSDNVTQYLKYNQEDLLGKSIYNIIHVGDHTQFSSSLFPPAASSMPWGSEDNQGSKSRTFECRMLIKPAGEESDDMEVKQTQMSQYVNMQISAILQPIPRDKESDLTNAEIDNQSCLVCIARRVGFEEKTAAMLGIEQFTTKQDLQGKILACDTSGIKPALYTYPNFISQNIQEFCHVNDCGLVDRHHQEVVKNGSNTSGVYRFKLQENRYVFVQTKSKLFTNPSTLKPEFIMSTHSVVRECDTDTELKGSASTSLMKSIIAQSGSKTRDMKSSGSSGPSTPIMPFSCSSLGKPLGNLNRFLSSPDGSQDGLPESLQLNEILDLLPNSSTWESVASTSRSNNSPSIYAASSSGTVISGVSSTPTTHVSWSAIEAMNAPTTLPLRQQRGPIRSSHKPPSSPSFCAQRSPGYAPQRSPSFSPSSSGPMLQRSSSVPGIPQSPTTGGPGAMMSLPQQNFNQASHNSPHQRLSSPNISSQLTEEDFNIIQTVFGDPLLSEAYPSIPRTSQTPSHQPTQRIGKDVTSRSHSLSSSGSLSQATSPRQGLQGNASDSQNVSLLEHIWRLQCHKQADPLGGVPDAQYVVPKIQQFLMVNSRTDRSTTLRDLLLKGEEEEAAAAAMAAAASTSNQHATPNHGLTSMRPGYKSPKPGASPQVPQSTTATEQQQEHPDSSSKDIPNPPSSKPQNAILIQLLNKQDNSDDEAVDEVSQRSRRHSSGSATPLSSGKSDFDRNEAEPKIDDSNVLLKQLLNDVGCETESSNESPSNGGKGKKINPQLLQNLLKDPGREEESDSASDKSSSRRGPSSVPSMELNAMKAESTRQDKGGKKWSAMGSSSSGQRCLRSFSSDTSGNFTDSFNVKSPIHGKKLDAVLNNMWEKEDSNDHSSLQSSPAARVGGVKRKSSVLADSTEGDIDLSSSSQNSNKPMKKNILLAQLLSQTAQRETVVNTQTINASALPQTCLPSSHSITSRMIEAGIIKGNGSEGTGRQEDKSARARDVGQKPTAWDNPRTNPDSPFPGNTENSVKKCGSDVRASDVIDDMFNIAGLVSLSACVRSTSSVQNSSASGSEQQGMTSASDLSNIDPLLSQLIQEHLQSEGDMGIAGQMDSTSSLATTNEDTSLMSQLDQVLANPSILTELDNYLGFSTSVNNNTGTEQFPMDANDKMKIEAIQQQLMSADPVVAKTTSPPTSQASHRSTGSALGNLQASLGNPNSSLALPGMGGGLPRELQQHQQQQQQAQHHQANFPLNMSQQIQQQLQQQQQHDTRMPSPQAGGANSFKSPLASSSLGNMGLQSPGLPQSASLGSGGLPQGVPGVQGNGSLHSPGGISVSLGGNMGPSQGSVPPNIALQQPVNLQERLKQKMELQKLRQQQDQQRRMVQLNAQRPGFIQFPAQNMSQMDRLQSPILLENFSELMNTGLPPNISISRTQGLPGPMSPRHQQTNMQQQQQQQQQQTKGLGSPMVRPPGQNRLSPFGSSQGQISPISPQLRGQGQGMPWMAHSNPGIMAGGSVSQGGQNSGGVNHPGMAGGHMNKLGAALKPSGSSSSLGTPATPQDTGSKFQFGDSVTNQFGGPVSRSNNAPLSASAAHMLPLRDGGVQQTSPTHPQALAAQQQQQQNRLMQARQAMQGGLQSPRTNANHSPFGPSVANQDPHLMSPHGIQPKLSPPTRTSQLTPPYSQQQQPQPRPVSGMGDMGGFSLQNDLISPTNRIPPNGSNFSVNQQALFPPTSGMPPDRKATMGSMSQHVKAELRAICSARQGQQPPQQISPHHHSPHDSTASASSFPDFFSSGELPADVLESITEMDNEQAAQREAKQQQQQQQQDMPRIGQPQTTTPSSHDMTVSRGGINTSSHSSHSSHTPMYSSTSLGSNNPGGGGASNMDSSKLHQAREEARMRYEKFLQLSTSGPGKIDTPRTVHNPPQHRATNVFFNQLMRSGGQPDSLSSMSGGSVSQGGSAAKKQKPSSTVPVNVVQTEPRMPIEDMKPNDHRNSLLQQLLSDTS